MRGAVRGVVTELAGAVGTVDLAGAAEGAGVLGVGPGEVLVGCLVGAAVLLAAGPRGRAARSLRRGGGSGRGNGRRSVGQVVVGVETEPGEWSWVSRALGWFGLSRAARPGGPPSVQVIVTQVAGLLRAGVAPGRAWQSVGQVRVDPRGVPDAEDLIALVVAGAGRGPVRGSAAAAARRQVAAIVAACRLAAETGAPLAAVLDVIVGTLVAAARGEQERAAALAGPRSTARVLAWLPGIGAVVGIALGADPLGLLLAGGLGATAPIVGLVLVGVGHRWTTRLVARARAAGDPL